MSALAPELRAYLERLLAERRDPIIDAGTDWIIGTADDLRGRRPRAETRALVAQEFDAYRDLLLRGDPARRDAFIEHVTTYRASAEFKISTLLRGFLGFKRGVEAVLAAEATGPALALAVRDHLDRLYCDTAFLMADVYVDKLNAVLRRTEHELMRREKMAALGGLVAGVAHEINTPLGIAVTAASLLDARVRELDRAFQAGDLRRSALAAFVDDARQAADLTLTNLGRAAELVQSFKQVAVDQSHDQRRRVHLGPYLHEVLASLAPLYKRGDHRVELVVDDPIDAETYPGAIAQIAANLVQNALQHAFPEGRPGCLEIRLRRLDDGRAELTFADDGRGMSDDERARAFEPFYTTRRGQGGSGLGLPIVHNLVTDLLRGEITLESGPGRGSTFTLRLPVA